MANEVQRSDGWRQRVYKENRRAEQLRTTLQERDLALYGPPRLTLAKAGARRVVHQHAHPCSPLHSHGTNAAKTVFNCSICGAYNAVRGSITQPEAHAALRDARVWMLDAVGRCEHHPRVSPHRQPHSTDARLRSALARPESFASWMGGLGARAMLQRGGIRHYAACSNPTLFAGRQLRWVRVGSTRGLGMRRVCGRAGAGRVPDAIHMSIQSFTHVSWAHSGPRRLQEHQHVRTCSGPRQLVGGRATSPRGLFAAPHGPSTSNSPQSSLARAPQPRVPEAAFKPALAFCSLAGGPSP